MAHLSRSLLIKALLILSIFLVVFTGCNRDIGQSMNSLNTTQQNATFAVYLVPFNQIIFSEDDLLSYSGENNTFTFTKEGVRKMRLYQPASQINAGLYQSSFVMKLGDEELYRGKFWTGLSSHLEDGIFLSDVVLISEDYPVLKLERISITIADSFNIPDVDDSKLIEHFRKIKKLK